MKVAVPKKISAVRKADSMEIFSKYILLHQALEKEILTKRQRLQELSNEPDMVDAGMIEPEIVASKKEELEARWVPLNVLPVVTRRSKLAILSVGLCTILVRFQSCGRVLTQQNATLCNYSYSCNSILTITTTKGLHFLVCNTL